MKVHHYRRRRRLDAGDFLWVVAGILIGTLAMGMVMFILVLIGGAAS